MQFDFAVDHWTPVVFGFVGWLMHFESFSCARVLGSFSRFLVRPFITSFSYTCNQVFNFVMGLFATIGYRGGLGIIFSIPIWICCLFSLLAYLICDDSADLNLAWKFWEGLHGTKSKPAADAPPAEAPA